MTDQPDTTHSGEEAAQDHHGPRDLPLHLVASHADPMATHRTQADNEEQHRYEHTGPGTIRNHDVMDWSYDPAKARRVLEEAQEPPGGRSCAPEGFRPQMPPEIESARLFVTDLKTGTPTRGRYRCEPGLGDFPSRVRELLRRSPARQTAWDQFPPPGKSNALAVLLEAQAAMLDRMSLIVIEEEPEIIPSHVIVEGFTLAMHLADAHADVGSLDDDPDVNREFHHHEHADGGWGHAEDDLSYSATRVTELLRQQADLERGDWDGTARVAASGAQHLALHMAVAHEDDGALSRTEKGNDAAHRAIGPHRHSGIQERYEKAAIDLLEASGGDGTLIPYSPVAHPPHDIADLGRMTTAMHEETPALGADMVAIDLAWIKTAGWPWHRRLAAGFLLAFSWARSPSWYLSRASRLAQDARKG